MRSLLHNENFIIFFSFQHWIEKYLVGSVASQSFFEYLGDKDNEKCDIDALLITICGYYMGKCITIVSPAGIWSTETTVNHDIVLIHRGGSTFLDTDSTEGILSSICLSNAFFFLIFYERKYLAVDFERNRRTFLQNLFKVIVARRTPLLQQLIPEIWKQASRRKQARK